MATPVARPKPWRAEYRRITCDRVVCRTSATTIYPDSFCLINLVPAYKTALSKEFDCIRAHWQHAACILQMKKKIRESKYGTVVFRDSRKILE